MRVVEDELRDKLAEAERKLNEMSDRNDELEKLRRDLEQKLATMTEDNR